MILGLDAAEKDLILYWARRNILPAMNRLLRESAWGFTQNPPGLYHGAVWPSFCTGVSPARHGQYCFDQLKPGTYQILPFSSEQMKAEPFWTRLSHSGKRFVVLDVPMMALKKSINGIQITDWAAHDLEHKRFQVWPESLEPFVVKNFGKGADGWTCDRLRTRPRQYLKLRDKLIKRVYAKEKLFTYLLTRENWDCFFGVFGEAHCAGHHFWHWHDTSHLWHRPEWVRRWGNPLRDVYRAMDASIGRLLKRVDSATTVMLYASHGMGSHYDGNHLLNRILQRLEQANGYQMPGKSSGKSLARKTMEGLWRSIPLRLRSRSFVKLRKKIRYSDLGTQACFQVPVNEAFGGIRVNLEGREPAGRINPGTEYGRFCERIKQDLLDLVNPETGEQVVQQVHQVSELYPGEDVSGLPDLLVEWNRRNPIHAAVSSKAGLVYSPVLMMRSGDHRPEGLYMLRGSSIRPGHVRARVHVMDFVPTLADLLEVSVPCVQGKSFSGLLYSEKLSGV